MFDKFYVWVSNNTIAIFVSAVLFSCVVAIFNLIDVVRKPPTIEAIEGSIQHHLVWSLKGECFFVRPHSNETVYLIRVKDCDKSDTTIKAIK
jgi:hypothetical protein